MGTGGGGAMTMVCPYTGSISASLAISGDLSSTTQAVTHQQQHQLGISSLSLYASRISQQIHPTKASLALAYGGKPNARGGNNNDCAAMLISLLSHNPNFHWKARLPEAYLSAGLILARCGDYAIGGGASGTLYVWSTMQGSLIKTIPRAHYRAVTCLYATTGDQRHVLTGGADGMVHLFAWMDLVETTTTATTTNQNNNSNNLGKKQKAVVPIRTWSQHSVPITCLESLSDYRMVSASQDGLLHIFETFSEVVVATIQLPQGVSSLAVRNQRIWVGGSLGTLYCLDLDVYAVHQTVQLGSSIASQRQSSSSSLRKGNDRSGGPSYQTTLKGHQHPVTSLALWSDDQGQEFLVSGDSSGTLRVWDLGARVCVRVVRPWSTTTDGPVVTKPKKTDPQKKHVAVPQHPISSIQVLEVADDTNTQSNSSMTTAVSKTKGGASSWVSRLPQLQKYAPSHGGLDPSDGAIARQTQWMPVPLWNVQAHDDVFWDVTKENSIASRKRLRTIDSENTNNELRQLREQLRVANATIDSLKTTQN